MTRSLPSNQTINRNCGLRAKRRSISGSAEKTGKKTTTAIVLVILSALTAAAGACQKPTERGNGVRPLVMRDVPANRLAYRFEPDAGLPGELADEGIDKLETIQADFTARRPNDALMRTVVSPDNQRALALYGTEEQPGSAFRIDLYSTDGKFLRNLTPPDLSCFFPETVSWSSDGSLISFIARKAVAPAPTPTPPPDVAPDVSPEAVASPSIAPVFPTVAAYNTEQIYVCNRDGFDLKPLTQREGLIYFYSSWAPDNHALVALACKEAEWDAREREYKLPAGRPRLIGLDGKERLLDDNITEALPVWSADSSKVATGFESDIVIYDASNSRPTQARITLSEALIKASVAYESKGKKSEGEEPGQLPVSLPASYNPIVRLNWPRPDVLYFQTAYVRVFPNDPINNFQRWHRLTLSAQAAILR